MVDGRENKIHIRGSRQTDTGIQEDTKMCRDIKREKQREKDR